MKADRTTADPRTETSFLRRYQLVLSMMVAFTLGATVTSLAISYRQVTRKEDFAQEDVTREKIAQEDVARAQEDGTAASMTLDYHKPKFDWTKSWCPTGQCRGSYLCYPCQRRWLIIVTPGRAGSTTLSEMFHRLPGLRVSGETDDAINWMNNYIHNFQEADRGTTQRFTDDSRHYEIRNETWSCLSQHLFEVMNPPDMGVRLKNNKPELNREHLVHSEETLILGFKTILVLGNIHKDRVPEPTPEYIQGKVDMMNRLFPCARFIVNSRSDIASHFSSWKYHMKEKQMKDQKSSMEKLTRLNRLHEEFYKAMGSERAFFLDSTQWTKDVSKLNEVLDWLGFNKKCHFKELLKYNAVGAGFSHGKKELKIDPGCKLMT